MEIVLEKLDSNSIGFSEIEKKIGIRYVDDRFSGYATELASNDIRIAVAPIRSLDDLRTLFHELGHAMSYSLNNEEGLFRIIPSSLDESMAVIFEYHYNKLGLEIKDPSIWAYDSFRSIDPVYIHNYVIGASIAEKLTEYLDTLYTVDYESWGKWLHCNIYFDGWRRDIKDKFLLI